MEGAILTYSLLAVGLVLLTLGGDTLVRGASTAARSLGVSPLLIGLTLVGFGTSLPEMVTSIVAAIRRHADVALGNIVGSNIYNVLGILGVTALITPIQIPVEIARFDIWVMLAATALLVIFVRTGMRLSRWEGFALFAAYAAYVAWLVRGAI